MKLRRVAAAGCALAGIAMANVALAQGGWPQLSIADIEPCRPQITQFHQMELAHFRSEIGRYCTPGAQYYSAHNCGVFQQELSASQQQNDMAWYYKGNGSCGGGDYPCFGVEVVNDPRSGEEETRWVSIFERNLADMGTTITPGMNFWDAGHVVDNCTTAIWLQKYKAWRNGAASPAPAPLPAQSQPQQIAARPISASDPAFNSRLQTSQPDQLLALAQELLATGQIDLAKLARNALLARYPDSPLVPTMVDLLVAASASSPAPAPAPAAAPPVATPTANVAPAYAAAPTAPPRLFIRDAASLTSAFAQAGYTLVPTSSPSQLVDSQNRFYAYFLDCNTGSCLGIQLLSKYSFSPLPTHERIVQWNRDKLYGRAYLDGNLVSFDMAIRIPSNGAEPLALKESIDLFLDASNAFYNHALGR